MARIVIPPDEVRRVAGQFDQQRSEAEAQMRMLTAVIDGLVWEGVTKESFRQSFEDAKRKMTQFIELHNQISQELKVIADKFENADNQGRR